MAGKVSRGWDAVAHEALLLCLLDEVKPNKAVLTKVTERMRAAGYTYSYDAINQHVQKLRRSRDMGTLGKAAAGGTPTKATPKKKTPSKRNKKELSPTSMGEDDDDEISTLKREADADVVDKKPDSKRVKREVKKETTPFVEIDGGDDDGGDGGDGGDSGEF
ncbi:hypothetical protein L249_2396 [Ophiocordyceps polyrhachis-furcata BCC 54312]|uniref:Uncharacterized protein n=1 Tax=Ophiocordyceps polyrhachis-furcata BCC 54312 TaxID=1330021 RepID=A0A367LPG7_9HYPO|nr:hypothetical protein L249_2396 [Ophiocordyceps polyrhachis-furcata BCC 54312]